MSVKIGKKRGAPKIILDPEKVEYYASLGMTMQQIADMFGVHLATLYERKNEFDEISEALRRGKAKGIAFVTEALKHQVESGNPGSTIFFLKSRASWSENQAQLDIMQKQIDELKSIIAGSESD